MPIPHNFTAHAVPVFQQPDLPVDPSSSSVADAAREAPSRPPTPATPPRVIRSALQKSLTEQLQSQRKAEADDAGLPAELWLKVADHAAASPKSLAQLSSTSKAFRGLLANHVKLASILGNADKLRDVSHFKALLTGEDKAGQGVTYCVHDLQTDVEKTEALEVLGSHLINLSHDWALVEAIDAFNEAMQSYQGPRSTLLDELEKAGKKAVLPGKMTPDMKDILQMRQTVHFTEIIERAKKGEPLEALMKEFGIATDSAQRFLAAEAQK
jgi:hypothetical protein